MSQQLQVGVGKCEIKLNPSCFPTDNFIGVHDPLYARVIVMETADGENTERYGILSLDLTSMFPSGVKSYKELFEEQAQIDANHSWITVTHNFTSPHLWEVPAPGEPDTISRPGHPVRSEEELNRCRNTNVTYYNAAKEAIAKALANLQPALCGSDTGMCGVNASRNMETKDGWWLGCDAEEFSDHSVPVLKFETLNKKPIALLFAYDCQSSVMGKSMLSTGGKLASSDLIGNAAVYVEQEYGDEFIAIPFCGAAGDQEPQLKSNRTEIDRFGEMRSIDLGEAGFVLLEVAASRLGAEIFKVSERIICKEATVIKSRRDFICEAKTIERNLKNLHPTRSYDYTPDGEKESEVQVFVIGDFAMVGTRAELASKTGAEIRNASPYANTAVITMVDGGAKYMVNAEAYDAFMYGAMNSFFQKGSAERLRDEAIQLLTEMHKN